MFGFLTSSSTTRLYRGRAPRQERLTILRAATHETELGDHDFCLSRSHYTDTDPTCRERAATAGIEPGTSSPVESFTYLGSIIYGKGGTEADVRTGIGKARTAFANLSNVWKASKISISTKIRLFNSNVKSVRLRDLENNTRGHKQTPGVCQ